MDDVHLEFIVMDYDRFSRDDLIGSVKVGCTASTDMGQTHWEEMLSMANQPISRWHPILPPSEESEHAHTL